MDTKDDKRPKQQQQPSAVVEMYPTVSSLRITPVPLADSALQNGFAGQKCKTFGYNDKPATDKAAALARPHLRLEVSAAPMRFGRKDLLPILEDFNRARRLIMGEGEEAKVDFGALASLEPIDKKLLGHWEGYRLMETNGAWYLKNCLKGAHFVAASQKFEFFFCLQANKPASESLSSQLPTPILCLTSSVSSTKSAPETTQARR